MTTGEIAVGQPLDAKGAHTLNDKRVLGFSYDQNAVARAIAGIGQPGTKFSKQAIINRAKLVAAMQDVGAMTEDPDSLPHSFFAYKDCPCDPMRDAIPEVMALARQFRKQSQARNKR